MKKRTELPRLAAAGQEVPAVWLTDEVREARRLSAAGACVVFVLTPQNRDADIFDIPYCTELQPDWDKLVPKGHTAGFLTEYLEKVWQRSRGLPWHILDTPRLRVREMTAEDLDALYALHSDPDMEQFADGLLPDRDAERTRLEAYIRHMYGFYEFGIWLVTLRAKAAGTDSSGQTETIIGRAGLQLREGFDSPELGFAIAAPYRGQGYAFEVCRAVLQYGFEELELPEIRAVVHRDNRKSLGLCAKLGFTVDNTAVFPDGMWTGLVIRKQKAESGCEA